MLRKARIRYRSDGDADAVLVAPRSASELRARWSRMPSLRWVHALSAGVEPLLFPELVESDVVLTNGRGIFAPALAEWVVGAILYFAKGFARLTRQKRWEPFHVERVEGQTVGILGYGSIGRAIGERCAALGMQVIGVSRHEGSLDEMLRASDYVVVCTPLTDETRGLIGRREIAKMRRNAVLVNVGRGAVVDEAALVRALQSHRIK